MQGFDKNNTALQLENVVNIATHKTVLVVDDNTVNRLIMRKILMETYNVVEAENGKIALECLANSKVSIAAIMLDISMPVMDGYEFLTEISKQDKFKEIPVIVTTGNSDFDNEGKALELGAWDFVSKPYSAKILKFRLKNAIARSEMAAFDKLKYLAEYDSLTGVFNKSKFLKLARKMVDSRPDLTYAIVRLDIEKFQLINSFFGQDEGDKLLKYISNCIRVQFEKSPTFAFGRVEADVFCLCVPYDDENTIQRMVEQVTHDLSGYKIEFDVVPKLGVCVINDKATSMNVYLDNASIAAKSCKGNFIKNYAFYTDEMGFQIEREQRLINNMKQAIVSDQFVIYLQPKYDLHTNQIAGAEALVRWITPNHGMLSPGEFIPVFERNGYISKLDYCVWEQVCKLIRKWIDQGKNPLPVSVNVSRVNLYNPKLVDNIISLVKKYEIPHYLLQLELTESAYTDNPKVIGETMERLQSNGFAILMDDFGSGYSSLNMLKDIVVDVLKIDMKFLSEADIAGRGENILASIIRMAKWLNMPVVAEGVEEEKQVDFLRSIGCEFVQGYYFAKPMPVAEYELLMENETAYLGNEKLLESFDANELWVTSSSIEAMFSNIFQAGVVYEYNDGCAEMLRVNKMFYEMFGFQDMTEQSRDVFSTVDPKYKNAVINAFNKAVETRGCVECTYLRLDSNGTQMWVLMKLTYIKEVGGNHIILGSLADVSSQKELDMELQKFRAVANKTNQSTGKILVVDNVKQNRDILKNIFADEFELVEAENGLHALDLLKMAYNEIDLILLNLVMPIMSGTEFMEHRKLDANIASVPVIIVIADESPEQQICALALGADDFILKPFVAETVKKRVLNVINSKKHFREVIREYNEAVELGGDENQVSKVYNRSCGEKRISELLNESSFAMCAMMAIDVDNFSDMKTRFGVGKGDELIAQVTALLHRFFRKSDIIVRCGDDEFLMFMTNIESVEFLDKRCKELMKSVNATEINGEIVTCSMGVALAPKHGDTFAKLFTFANQALDLARSEGKNRYRIFSNGLSEKA